MSLPELEVVDGDGRRIANFPAYGSPHPRIGETFVLDDAVDGSEVRGEVVDVRHYPDEFLVAVELDESAYTERGGSA